VVKLDPEVVLEDDLYTLNIAFAKERVKSEVDNLSNKDE
jgi:hypothetical protein